MIVMVIVAVNGDFGVDNCGLSYPDVSIDDDGGTCVFWTLMY